MATKSNEVKLKEAEDRIIAVELELAAIKHACDVTDKWAAGVVEEVMSGRAVDLSQDSMFTPIDLLDLIKAGCAKYDERIARWGELMGDPIGGDFAVLDQAIIEMVNENAEQAERIAELREQLNSWMDHVRTVEEKNATLRAELAEARGAAAMSKLRHKRDLMKIEGTLPEAKDQEEG